MDRRAFLGTLAGGLLAAPLAAGAQSSTKPPVVGSLSSGPNSQGPSILAGPLAALGQVEGKTFVLEMRYAEGRVDRLPALAGELVRLNAAVIVTWGVEPLEAVRKVTNQIPIVMVGSSDPVGMGLAASYARPGGNVTGVTFGGSELAGKRLALLREALPGLSRVALLRDPGTLPASVQQTESSARALKLRLEVFAVKTPADLAGAFKAAVKSRADAMLVNESSMLTAQRAKLAELGIQNRLPVIGSLRQSTEAGLLMSYGVDLPHVTQRIATQVDRILKGVRPGDLPFEEPTKFELVVNLKTAKALGRTIPPSVLQRADQVIE
jgi:putative ABC transport system substrate-binding protein